MAYLKDKAAKTTLATGDKLAMIDHADSDKVKLVNVENARTFMQARSPAPDPISSDNNLDLTGLAGYLITVIGTTDIEEITGLDEGDVAYLSHTDTGGKYVYDASTALVSGKGDYTWQAGDVVTVRATSGGYEMVDVQRASGQAVKRDNPSVRTAGVANVTIATLNNHDTLNGISLNTGDVVLLTAQTAPEENGIYVVGATTSTRHEDYTTYDSLAGLIVFVVEPGTSLHPLWASTSDPGGVLDTDPLVFIGMSYLIPANNLSDVADPATALANLGGASILQCHKYTIDTAAIQAATSGGTVVQVVDLGLAAFEKVVVYDYNIRIVEALDVAAGVRLHSATDSNYNSYIDATAQGTEVANADKTGADVSRFPIETADGVFDLNFDTDVSGVTQGEIAVFLTYLIRPATSA